MKNQKGRRYKNPFDPRTFSSLEGAEFISVYLFSITGKALPRPLPMLATNVLLRRGI